MVSADIIWYFRKRYLVSFLTFLGMVCMYLIRTNLSIAIVEMTSSKNISNGNETIFREAEFKWTSKEKGFILSLFFYGYLFSPLGGLFSAKYGGATTFGLGIGLTAILTILTPFFLRQNMYVYSVARVLEGLFEGCTFASSAEIFVHWAPPNEISRLMVNAYMGCAFGPAINYMLSGFIAHKWGWEAVFHITGGIALLWFLLWILLVSNEPGKDKFISNAEREYLTDVALSVGAEKTTYPWKEILTSMPFWAYINELFSTSWTYSFTLSGLPMYIKDVNDVNIRDIGLIASIPTWCAFISHPLAAILADYLRSRKILTIPNVHKLFISFGQAAVAVLLIITGLWLNFQGSIVTLSLIRICFAITNTSYQVLPVDLFSQYASLAKGCATTGFGLGSLFSPLVMGLMVTHHSRTEWNHYFLILSILNIWSGVVFVLFGSGELQPWINSSKLNKKMQQDSINTCGSVCENKGCSDS